MQLTAPHSHFKIYSLSEQAITIEFGTEITEEIAARVSNFNQLIIRNPFKGLITTIPAYATVTVYFETLTVFQSELPGANCFEKISSYLSALTNQTTETSSINVNRLTIPVCYEEEFALDIVSLAEYHKLTVDEVINLHTSAFYKVYMIGFVPGFAYMGGLAGQLSTPRKETPRKVVPQGSVGIAGNQTGVYPLTTPGGWQIIGRTPLVLFDANRTQPSLFKAGDQVVFKAISIAEFHQLAE